jgi:type IV pilus assembly protein PilC
MAAMEKTKRVLPNREISAFCAQLALVVGAGISVQEGLLILCEDAEKGPGQALLEELCRKVEMGAPLSQALGDSGRFPDYLVQMVEIGETSGRLEEVLASLTNYYDRSDAMARSVKNAVTYPMVMILMMLLVILVLVVQVLPIFQDVFHQLGGEMSGFALGIMGMGQAMSRYAAYILGAIAVLAVGFLLLRRFPGGRAFLSRLYQRMFRKLSYTIAAGRFASAMALMLSSGVDVDRALVMAKELMDDQRLRENVDRVQERMAAGDRFADALVETGIFSGINARMVLVGFRTGSLDTVMERIAQGYEEEADDRIGSLISRLEPTLVAVLSLVVGMILLSVMLPLMGIMSAIG